MEAENSPKKSNGFWKTLLVVGLSAILLFEAFAGYKVYSLSQQHEKIREDYSVVNSILFGLLSISQWRDKLAEVVSHKLHTFHLTKDQLHNLEAEVEDILHALVKKAVEVINKDTKTVSGKLKKAAFHTFIDEKDLHEQVPVFSKEIIRKVNSPASIKRLTEVAESKFNEFQKETFDSAEYVEKTIADSIYYKYQAKTHQEFDSRTEAMLSSIYDETNMYALAMVACILLFLALWWAFWKKPWLHIPLFVMSIMSALILLMVGINTTMIEVDARIEKLELILLGKSILFENQVLFFQSKSIMAVVKILLTAGKYDAILVGILLLLFSVLFPIFKLASLGIYLLGKPKWTKGSFFSYFAFKSGKWSMADVMVIGILMTYIGFNSIIESQMADMNIRNESLTSITTNNTSLQPGYIVFVGFVLYGLILSEILKRIAQQAPSPAVDRHPDLPVAS